jgi:hypothetical protein
MSARPAARPARGGTAAAAAPRVDAAAAKATAAAAAAAARRASAAETLSPAGACGSSQPEDEPATPRQRPATHDGPSAVSASARCGRIMAPGRRRLRHASIGSTNGVTAGKSRNRFNVPLLEPGLNSSPCHLKPCVCRGPGWLVCCGRV